MLGSASSSSRQSGLGSRQGAGQKSAGAGEDVRGPARGNASNVSGSKVSSAGTHRFDPKNRLGVAGANEMSPRLLSLDDAVEIVGASLLPDVDEGPKERFCVEKELDYPGMPRRSSGMQMSQCTFPTVVTRLDQSVSQASVMLCDRLRTLRIYMNNTGGLSDSQLSDLCDLADDMAAASYHLQKWAALLSPPGAAHMPCKPSPCEDQDEAFAIFHSSTPRILVGAGESHKGLSAAIKAHGSEAESHVNKLGVPTKDLRVMGPHLEHIIFRLSRLSSRLRADRQKLREFIPSYFAPKLGPKLAEHLLVYLRGADGF